MTLENKSKAHLWKPGQSGNPGGRPKGLALQIREATHDGADLVKVLVDALNHRDPKIRLEATRIAFDRGYGRALEVTAQVEAGSELRDQVLELLASTDLATILGHTQATLEKAAEQAPVIADQKAA